MKILLADDHRMMREGLRAVLEKEGLEVVGEAASGREALALSQSLRPDVVVMDITMPDLNGIDATRRLMDESPGCKVVALSMHADRRYVRAMFAAGAAGYLVKHAASDELVLAVKAVAQGQKYVSASVAGVVIDGWVGQTAAEPAQVDRTLSPREREVLQLLAEGHTSKEIASRLAIALPTVETHRRQIMAKTGLRTIADLTKFAIREGLTSVGD
jgi:DNA-binding NarL/FixJ family response regulator